MFFTKIADVPKKQRTIVHCYCVDILSYCLLIFFTLTTKLSSTFSHPAYEFGHMNILKHNKRWFVTLGFCWPLKVTFDLSAMYEPQSRSLLLMERRLCVKNNVVGGTHDADHAIVAGDRLLTGYFANLVSDMLIDPTVGDGPVNDVVGTVNDITTAL